MARFVKYQISMSPNHIKVRRVLHILKTEDMSLTISGVSVTLILPDGTEDETIIPIDFGEGNAIGDLLTAFEIPLPSARNISQSPKRTVTYLVKR